MNEREVAGYTRMQRWFETSAIVLFAVLVAWNLYSLVTANDPHLPMIMAAAGILGWLASDLLSGLLHFAFDSWGSVKTPIIGQAFIRPFREHHVDPTEITRHDFVETNGASCIAGLPILGLAAFLPLETAGWIFSQALLWFITMGALVTNQCHKWAHMEEASMPQWIRWAQRWRLILPREHHLRHHTVPYDAYFCMSNGWLNAPFNAILRRCR